MKRPSNLFLSGVALVALFFVPRTEAQFFCGPGYGYGYGHGGYGYGSGPYFDERSHGYGYSKANRGYDPWCGEIIIEVHPRFHDEPRHFNQRPPRPLKRFEGRRDREPELEPRRERELPLDKSGGDQPATNSVPKPIEPKSSRPAVPQPPPTPRSDRKNDRFGVPSVSEETQAREGSDRRAIGDFPVDTALVTSTGETTSIAELFEGSGAEAVLIDFWASWCGPCLDSFPELKRRETELAEAGVAVVGMNVESDQALAERIRQNYGIEFPWLVEPRSQIFSRQFQIDSIPRAILVDRDGRVLFNGAPDDNRLEALLSDYPKQARNAEGRVVANR